MYDYSVKSKPLDLDILISRLGESNLSPTFILLKWCSKVTITAKWTDPTNRISINDLDDVDYSQYGLGLVTDDRLVIVDIDTDEMYRFATEHGLLVKDTLSITSGKKINHLHGELRCHLYYRLTDEQLDKLKQLGYADRPIKDSQKFDLRRGNGNYTQIPTHSPHPDTKTPYRVLLDNKIADLPSGFFEAVLEVKRQTPAKEKTTSSQHIDINQLCWQKENKKPLYIESDRSFLNQIVSPNLDLYEAFLPDHKFVKKGDEFCGHPLLRESASGESLSVRRKNGEWKWLDRATQGGVDRIGGDLFNYYLLYIKRLDRDEIEDLAYKPLIKECLKYYCKKKNIIIPHRYERGLIHIPPGAVTQHYEDDVTIINWDDPLKPVPTGDVKIIYTDTDHETEILALSKKAGHPHVLNTGQPGLGKTYTAAKLNPENFGLKRLYFTSTDYLNPQVETLKQLPVDVARHNGTYSEIRPNGEKRKRRIRNDKEITGEIIEDSNCTKVGRFAQLRQLGIPLPQDPVKQTNAICGTCGLFPDCDFIAQKKSIINLTRKIGHPYLYNDVSYGVPNFEAETLVVCDEISQHSLIEEKIITKDEINNLVSKLWEKKITLPNEVGDKLRSLIDVFLVDTSEYGLDSTDNHFSLISTDYDFEELRKIFTPKPEEIGRPDLVNFHIFDLLEVLAGKKPGAARTVKNNKNIEIILTIRNDYYIEMLNKSGFVYHLDATQNPDILKKILGVEKLAIIERQIPQPDNLEIIQIYPNVAVGACRAPGTESYINTIIEKIRDIEGDNIGIIDYGKFKDNYKNAGKYFADSRGSNDFQKNNTLILVGIIRANFNSLVSKFQTIYNKQPDITRTSQLRRFNIKGGDTIAKKVQVSKDDEFQKFLDDEIESETIQAIGRLRANRRPGEKLKVYLISDYPYKLPINKLIMASEFCRELMSETEKSTLKFINHVTSLPDAQCTLVRLCNTTKITKPRISEICNSILSHQLPSWLHDKIFDCIPKVEKLIGKKSLYSFINNRYQSTVVPFTPILPQPKTNKQDKKPQKMEDLIIDKNDEKPKSLLDIFATANYPLPDINEYIKTIKPYPEVRRVTLDIETIGLDPTGDDARVIAVGLKHNNGDNICITGITEKELLIETIATLKKLKPEIIVGHNIFNFDLPFLIKRMEIHGIKSPFKYEIDRYNGGVKIKRVNAAKLHGKPLEFKSIKYPGAAIIDTYHQIIIWDNIANKLTSYALKRIREQIGHKIGINPTETRLELSADEIKTCYTSNNMEQLIIYLGQDLDDTFKLSEFLIPSIYYQQEFLDWDLQSIATGGNASKWSSIMKKIYPGLSPIPDPQRAYEGALTASRGGVWRNVAKIDITSLYPSIMLKYQVKPKLDVGNKFLALLKYLLDKRLELKQLSKSGDELANQRQGALKVLINSAYGFLGTPGVPFNDFDAAEKVTAYGREILIYMMSLVEKHGGTWIECDTDGIYYTAPNQESLLYVYNELSTEMPNGINVELEIKHALGAIIPKNDDGSGKKKNYIILFDDPKKDIKKGKFIKRDRTILEKEFYHQYCRFLISDEKSAYEYYQGVIEDIFNRNTDVEKLKRREKIKVNAKRLLTIGNPGDTVSWYQDSRGLPAIVGNDYDVNHYLNVINKSYIEIQTTAGLEINTYNPYNNNQLSLL